MAEQRDFIIRVGDGTTSVHQFYVGPAEGEESVVHGWQYDVDAATGFETLGEAVDEQRFVAEEGGYNDMQVVERETARRELHEAQERDAAPRRETERRESWFQSTREAVRGMISRWAKPETTTPALTPEGKALGYEWVTGAGEHGSALLWPQGQEAMEKGPVAAVDNWDQHPAAEWTITGSDERMQTRDEAMNVAENKATASAIASLSEASESYYAKLAALTESRGANMDQDAGDRDFGLDV